jgi:uncharacterized protein (TIGR02246 family)
MPATSLKSAIGQLNETFNAAFNRGDGATLAALYVPNAVLLPPGAEVQKGRAAIRSFWEGMMREYGELKLVTVDLKRYGEDTVRACQRERAAAAPSSARSVSWSGRRSAATGNWPPISRISTLKASRSSAFYPMVLSIMWRTAR